jgi:ankyrin repeat protein/Ca2+-binding EF-hand superfamily protein
MEWIDISHHPIKFVPEETWLVTSSHRGDVATVSYFLTRTKPPVMSLKIRDNVSIKSDRSTKKKKKKKKSKKGDAEPISSDEDGFSLPKSPLALLEEKLGKNPRIELGEEFIECSRESKVERMAELLAQGCDVNYRCSTGWCAVHWAARNGDLKALEFLQNAGANMEIVDRPGMWSPLHIAIKFEHMHAIVWLVERGANIRQTTRSKMTPLHWAAARGNVEIAEYLCNRANVELDESLREAEKLSRKFTEKKKQLLRDTTMIKIDCTDNRGFTPLHEAVVGGHMRFVQWLKEQKQCNLLKKTDVGLDALAYAQAKKHQHLVEYLEPEIKEMKEKIAKAKKRAEQKKKKRKARKRALRKAALEAEKAAEMGLDVEAYRQLQQKSEAGTLEADDVYHMMNFSEKDLDKFDEIFCNIDTDKSNFISPGELLNYFSINDTPFATRIFSMMDDSGDQRIDFKEFVCMMWLFCTVSEHQFVHFSFSLYDKDGSQTLEIDEIHDLISDVYGEHWKDNPKIKTMVDNMVSSSEGFIGLEEWEKLCKNHAMLLFPAFNMQKTLRDKSGGNAFWKKKETQRQDTHGKEFAAQEGLLAKLVSAPGEYNRSAGGIASLEELLDEEEKERQKNGVESEEDGDDIASEDLSSESSQKEKRCDDNAEDNEGNAPIVYTAESVAQMLEHSSVADK